MLTSNAPPRCSVEYGHTNDNRLKSKPIARPIIIFPETDGTMVIIIIFVVFNFMEIKMDVLSRWTTDIVFIIVFLLFY